MKILILNPNSDLEMTEAIQKTAKNYAGGEFEVICKPTPGAPKFIETYEDEIKTNVNLNVLKKEYNIGAIIFTILIIAIFAWGIYYFRKTKKAKDRTIHQLLQGENFDSELKETPKKPLKKSLKKFPETKTEREKKERRREEFKREILEKYKK